MDLEHLILSVVVIAGLILMIRYLGKKGHRCRWCRTSTVKIQDLPENDRGQIVQLIHEEGMGSADISSYDFCPTCNRLFDWRWFDDDRPYRRDWDMYDRQCHCGSDLRRPSREYISTDHLKKALERMRPEATRYVLEHYNRDEIPSILNDMTGEEHIFFVCPHCLRIYMWLPVKGFQVFQCVTRDMGPYDGAPTGREYL